MQYIFHQKIIAFIKNTILTVLRIMDIKFHHLLFIIDRAAHSVNKIFFRNFGQTPFVIDTVDPKNATFT